jgi:hypothetical protein
MVKLRSLAPFCVVVALPALALAGAFGHKAGTETFTEPSGRTGAKSVDAFTIADYYGLQAIKLTEYGGKPCVLDVEQSTFATRDLSKMNSVKVCDPTSGESWKYADVGSGKYVSALAVCTGAGKDDSTVHGIELWGGELAETGKLDAPKGSVRAQFPACKKWQPKRACPAGEAATGVRGFYDSATGGLQGLALRCHALEPRGK